MAPPPSPTFVSPSRPVVSSKFDVTEPAPAVVSQAESPASAVTAAEKKPSPKHHASPGASRGNTLDEELPLIARAQDAITNHPAAALAALNEHAARFPSGQLAVERNGLRVLALCSMGDPSASAMAAQFVRNHPRSPLAPRIQQACTRK
jgi:hypothetical protein